MSSPLKSYKAVLSDALEIANERISDSSFSVEGQLYKGSPKEPVFLSLLNKKEGTVTKIGITHLVRLDKTCVNWDAAPYESIARTTEAVAESILGRISLFQNAEKQGYYVYAKTGNIFDFSAVKYKIHEDDRLEVNGKAVTWQGTPFKISSIQSEGVIDFASLQNGDIELKDTIDQRPGKGIFIDSDGKIYRK